MQYQSVRELKSEVESQLSSFSTDNYSWNESLQLGRNLFFLSTQEKKYLEKAKSYFIQLAKAHPKSDLIRLYRAVLSGVQAKYAAWPLEKLRLVNEALSKIDPLVDRNYQALEFRFLRGAFCYNLPTVFQRRKQAQVDFDYVINNLNQLDLPRELELLQTVVHYFRTEVNDLNTETQHYLDELERQAQHGQAA